MPINGEPDPHIVQRFARQHLSAKAVGKRIGFDIGQMAFDIP